MARRLRTQFPDARYHIFNRGVNKCSIYHDDQDRRIFLKILHSTLLEFGLTLYAYCLMGNHYHLFLKISSVNLNKAMQKLQGRYATYFNSRHDRVGYLFQGRYHSRLIENDSYSLTVIRYIHQNPLEILDNKKTIEAYQWSSYPDYVCENQPQLKLLNTEWILNQFHDDTKKARVLFKKFHTEISVGSEGSDPYDPRLG